jgi:hypothetical protein
MDPGAGTVPEVGDVFGGRKVEPIGDDTLTKLNEMSMTATGLNARKAMGAGITSMN